MERACWLVDGRNPVGENEEPKITGVEDQQDQEVDVEEHLVVIRGGNLCVF